MSQFFRSITTASRQVTRVARPAPSNVRYISVTHARFSAAGYGDDPTEGASNSGTKTPASSPNPSKGAQGNQSGSTDPEVSSTKQSSGAKSDSIAEKQPGGKKASHSEEVDPEVKNALGSESGAKTLESDNPSDRKPGETVADKETKLPGKPVEKKE